MSNNNTILTELYRQFVAEFDALFTPLNIDTLQKVPVADLVAFNEKWCTLCKQMIQLQPRPDANVLDIFAHYRLAHIQCNRALHVQSIIAQNKKST